MSDLLKKYAEKTKSYAKRPQETVDVVINNIRGTKDERRVMLDTTKGQFFAFKNSFPNSVVPVFSDTLKATITLELNKQGDTEFVNVVNIKYDAEALGKFNLVATHGNAVVL